MNGDTAPVLATLTEHPSGSEDTAWHECGHAVVAHALGAAHQRIELDGQAHVAGIAPLSGTAAIAMLLAGPAAQRAYFRTIATLHDFELDEFFERVDTLHMGGCDACRAALHATACADLDDSDRRTIFRTGERLANELIARRDIRDAIRTLAAELIGRRSIPGTDAREIIDAFVPFGGTVHA
ncbi:hypothetical protein [Devosia riboflavina]